MNKTKRKQYSGKLKAKIAHDAIKEEQAIVEIATRFGIHPIGRGLEAAGGRGVDRGVCRQDGAQ
jgi:hypothetical protein